MSLVASSTASPSSAPSKKLCVSCVRVRCVRVCGVRRAGFEARGAIVVWSLRGGAPVETGRGLVLQDDDEAGSVLVLWLAFLRERLMRACAC